MRSMTVLPARQVPLSLHKRLPIAKELSDVHEIVNFAWLHKMDEF